MRMRTTPDGAARMSALAGGGMRVVRGDVLSISTIIITQVSSNKQQDTKTKAVETSESHPRARSRTMTLSRSRLTITCP
eukprot:scaffold25819_cov101-Isochrysis_galbana.AAC.2